MNRSRVAFVLGGVAVVLGIVVALEPSVASGVGTDRAMLTTVGIVAGYLAYRAVRGRRSVEFEQPTLPEVESKYSFDPPGASFTDRLQAATASKRANGRDEIREDLHRVTVDVLTTYRGYTESEAKTAIEDGTWTDDPYAAAFFTFEIPPRPLRARLTDAFEGRVAFERRGKHVIVELAAITEEP